MAETSNFYFLKMGINQTKKMWRRLGLPTEILDKDLKRRNENMANLENPLQDYNNQFIKEQEEMDLKNFKVRKMNEGEIMEKGRNMLTEARQTLEARGFLTDGINFEPQDISQLQKSLKQCSEKLEGELTPEQQEELMSELKICLRFIEQGGIEMARERMQDIIKTFGTENSKNALNTFISNDKKKHAAEKLSIANDLMKEKLKEYPISGLDPTSAIDKSISDTQNRWGEEAEESGGYDPGTVSDVTDPTSNNPSELIKRRIRDWVNKTAKLAQQEGINMNNVHAIKSERDMIRAVDKFYKNYDTAKLDRMDDWESRLKDSNLLKSIHSLYDLKLIKQSELPKSFFERDKVKIKAMMKGAGIKNPENFIGGTRKQQLDEEEVTEDDEPTTKLKKLMKKVDRKVQQEKVSMRG